MNPTPLVLAVAVGAVAAGVTGLVVAPRRRLTDKVRPYRAAAGDRTAAVSPHEGTAWTPTRGTPGLGVRERLESPESRARLASQLRAAGFVDATIEQFRVRQFGTAGAMAAAGALYYWRTSGDVVDQTAASHFRLLVK